jgi:ADP-heptose:LPS heptosyltransferase
MVGRENVFFVVFQDNRFILDAMEMVPPDNVFTISTRSLFSAARDALRSVRRMRKAGIDAAVDLEFFARSSAALTYLSGARRRVGFHAYGGEAAYRGDLMTHRLSFNPHLHTSQAFWMMVKALGTAPGQLPAFDLAPPPPEEVGIHFRPAPEETEQVKDLLRRHSPTGQFRPLIILNPNCGDLLPLRSWPAGRYVELARRLLGRYPDLHVAFTGSPAEAAETERLASAVASDRVILLAGRTSLRQLLAAYTLAEVLVTNDSGPAHFATLTDIDVVTLFGPETPRLFAAVSPRNHVLWSGIVCSPCVSAYNDRRSACRNNLCMQKISVGEVFEKVCLVYEKRLSERAGLGGAAATGER